MGDLAKELGVSKSAIISIFRGLTWKDEILKLERTNA